MSEFYALIQNAHVSVRIGIHDFEQLEPQPLLVTVQLWFPKPERRFIHSLQETVNYEPIRDLILGWATRPQIPYLEHLLTELVDAAFNDPRVTKVQARIRKTAIFAEVEEIGIGVESTRAEWFPSPLH